MNKWIVKTIFVPSLIGAACGAFFNSAAFTAGVSLTLVAVWLFGFEYFFQENVKTEDSG